MTGFQRLVLATSVATFILIVIGAVVRTTGSGFGCPDWPKCHGQFIPPFDKETLIEYSHRLAASVVGFLVVAVAAVAWLRCRGQTAVLVLSATALVLLVIQVSLGGATVLNDLPPEIVTAHLATALALFAALVATTTISLAAGAEPTPSQGEDALRFQRWAILGGVIVYLVLLSGSYVVGSGASLVSRDWPLVDNRLLPSDVGGITGRLLVIQWLHRFAVLVAGAALVAVAVKARRLRGNRRISVVTWIAVSLYAAQVLLGAANLWTRLSPVVASAHLAVGSAIWGACVVAFTLNRLALSPAAASTRNALRPAAGRR